MSEIDLAPPPHGTENRYAVCVKSAGITGWLDQQVARRTVDILRWQDANGITGNLMEIGVYCGRYFALLLHAALRQGNSVLGVDTFAFSNPERVEAEMRDVLGPAALAHMRLHRCNSAELLPEAVLDSIGRPRFLSLDGAHDMGTVYADLELAAAVLDTDGVIAANDVLNPLSPGVNEALNRFLMRPRRVVPVAFIGNKLFLAHRARASQYRAALEDILLQGGDAAAEAFATRARAGRHQIEQPFHGHPVLIS